MVGTEPARLGQGTEGHTTAPSGLWVCVFLRGSVLWISDRARCVLGPSWHPKITGGRREGAGSEPWPGPAQSPGVCQDEFSRTSPRALRSARAPFGSHPNLIIIKDVLSGDEVAFEWLEPANGGLGERQRERLRPGTAASWEPGRGFGDGPQLHRRDLPVPPPGHRALIPPHPRAGFMQSPPG